MSVDLGKKWTTFKTGYGLQAGAGGSVVFVIKADGSEVFRSDLIRDHLRRDFELDVSGVDSLELITEDGGNGNTSDHSIWVEPELSR